jgi:hypothetical protein
MSLVVLLTDFGLRDHYVATMKGVILSLNPSARIIDLSHDVQPQRVGEAGYLLWAAYRYFPAGTVFVCVVDPGVGSRRRILAAESGGRAFLAPDNGLLDFVILEEKINTAREIMIVGDSVKGLPGVTLRQRSLTFHGRDIFAPVAAALSSGKQWTSDAPLASFRSIQPVFVTSENRNVKPQILHIDRFGNLITNIRSTGADEALQLARRIRIGGRTVSRWITKYSEGSERLPSLIVGSSNLVEIVLKNGSAARTLKASLTSTLAIVRA